MSTEAVFFFAANLRIVAANASALAAAGYCLNQLQKMQMNDLLVSGAEEFHTAVDKLRDGEAPQASTAATMRSRDGVASSVEILLRLVPDRDDALFVALVRGRCDTTSVDRLDNQRDHLTSLPTRAVLDRRLRHAENRAREAGALYAVLFIDVDHFKSINDRNGHRVGDLVLQIVAERLRACVRPADVVSRYGGDEFVVLIDNVGVESEVEQIAARIRAELNRSIDIGGKQEPLAASVGVAIAKPLSVAQDLVDEADRAMYQAKAAKRMIA